MISLSGVQGESYAAASIIPPQTLAHSGKLAKLTLPSGLPFSIQFLTKAYIADKINSLFSKTHLCRLGLSNLLALASSISKNNLANLARLAKSGVKLIPTFPDKLISNSLSNIGDSFFPRILSLY